MDHPARTREPATSHSVRVGSVGVVAPKWHWLLVAIAAVTVACLVPGSMVSESPAASHSASIGAAAATVPSGIECAAVACNPGSPSVPSPAPPLALAGILAAGAFFVLLMGVVRHGRETTETLPRGNPLQLLRPPQLAFSL